MLKMPALLINTCRGAIRAFQASANFATESREIKSSSITFKRIFRTVSNSLQLNHRTSSIIKIHICNLFAFQLIKDAKCEQIHMQQNSLGNQQERTKIRNSKIYIHISNEEEQKDKMTTRSKPSISSTRTR